MFPQPKEEPPARPKSLAQLRMQLKAEREAEGKSAHSSRGGGDSWASSGPAAKSHLKELTRLMEGARTEAGKNFSELLQKLENIKQVRKPTLCNKRQTAHCYAVFYIQCPIYAIAETKKKSVSMGVFLPLRVRGERNIATAISRLCL